MRPFQSIIRQKCRKAWIGADCNCCGCGVALLEAADAVVHCRRYDLLYAAGADGVLIRGTLWNF